MDSNKQTPGNDPMDGLDPHELLARGLESQGWGNTSSVWEPPLVEDMNRMVETVEVKELIGRGGMGAVYRVWQEDLARQAAMKVLPSEISSDPALEARFLQEARAMAGLRHLNIVTIYDFGRSAEGHLFYLMEYVDGTDLACLIKAGKLDVPQALKVVSDVCDALEYAHGRGYVHRDIKPANVLVDRDGLVKVTDFGLAKILQPDEPNEMTRTGQVMGTPEYMAPEQSNGESVDHRADIYSIGVMLYEMLTGRLPKGVFQPPSKEARIDVKIDEVVLRALDQKPELRYQRASEIRTALDRLKERVPNLEGKKQRASAASGLMIGGALALLVAIAALAWWGISQKGLPQEDTRICTVDPSLWPQPGVAFQNSLSRSFISIPGTDVLFAVCETERSDWDLFVEETGHKWKAPTFSQELDHPVVNVSWQDAVTYCQWHTKRERKLGKIGPEMEYRLPTDQEWSTAAGLNQETRITSYEKRFHRRGFRGMIKPIPDWLTKPMPSEPQWNPSDFSGVNDKVFPWGKHWPPQPQDSIASPDRTYQAYSQLAEYKKVLSKPIEQVHWDAESSDLINLMKSNFGQDWATDLTTFGPLALTRIVWLYKQGKSRLFYHKEDTYCLIEPLMRLRQFKILEDWLGAELANFPDTKTMHEIARNYPHGDWTNGAAIGAHYQMEGVQKLHQRGPLQEWQEWQGFYSDPDTTPGKWIWSKSHQPVIPEWQKSIPKPSYLFETGLVLKKTGLLEPVNRHANFPFLMCWKGKRTSEGLEALCKKIYLEQTKAILAEFEDTMGRFVRPEFLDTSRKNSSPVSVSEAGVSTTHLKGLSGNVSEWVADTLVSPKNNKPVIAWQRGASWRLASGHRQELLSSHRSSDFCHEVSPQVGFRVVLDFKQTAAPQYRADQIKGHSYAFLTTTRSWKDAARLCREAGGYLVSIESQDEEEWLKKRFVDYPGIYLGASREVGVDSTVQRAGSWNWESGQPFSYFPERIPHNFSMKEATLKMNFSRDGWYDDQGEAPTSYIIEWD